MWRGCDGNCTPRDFTAGGAERCKDDVYAFVLDIIVFARTINACN
jgi:hypothetical protein